MTKFYQEELVGHKIFIEVMSNTAFHYEPHPKKKYEEPAPSSPPAWENIYAEPVPSAPPACDLPLPKFLDISFAESGLDPFGN
jgi:hypothetical protein